MRINKSMSALLQGVQVENIAPNYAYPIWQKWDEAGRPYWGVAHFWHMDRHGISQDQDLSILEWDGNEVYLESRSEEDVQEMLKATIAILKAWKAILERDYSHVPFYLLASYCDNQEERERGEAAAFDASATFRFWAPRGQDAVVDLDNFDDWKEPAILMECNRSSV